MDWKLFWNGKVALLQKVCPTLSKTTSTQIHFMGSRIAIVEFSWWTTNESIRVCHWVKTSVKTLNVFEVPGRPPCHSTTFAFQADGFWCSKFYVVGMNLISSGQLMQVMKPCHLAPWCCEMNFWRFTQKPTIRFSVQLYTDWLFTSCDVDE